MKILNTFRIVNMLLVIIATTTFADEPLQEQLKKLQIITHDMKPHHFINKNNKIDGLSFGIVKEIMERLNMKQGIKMWPWARAYNKAVAGPNFVLFAVGRIKERDSLFHWVGPIYRVRSNFYVKKGSGIKINNLDDAKTVRNIGTMRGDFNEQFLKRKGFTNLDPIRDYRLNIKRLMKGRISALGAECSSVETTITKMGFSINDIKKQYTFMKVLSYIVFSKQISYKVVDAWRQTLEDMKDDGFLTKLQSGCLNHLVVKLPLN